jgi:RNA polymerase sigma factor (sigma-70 family)
MTETRVANSTDAELVERCLRGEERAWDTLLSRHGPLVWNVALRTGLSEADAADAFQNAWTIALEELPRLRDPGRFPAWIARIARHRAMRIRRGYGIARKAHVHVAREDLDGSDPVADVEALERRHGVHQALERVGERCAALLRLLYFTSPEPSYAEIGDRLAMRVGSIGPTRARCLAKLRDTLTGFDPAVWMGGKDA